MAHEPGTDSKVAVNNTAYAHRLLTYRKEKQKAAVELEQTTRVADVYETREPAKIKSADSRSWLEKFLGL